MVIKTIRSLTVVGRSLASAMLFAAAVTTFGCGNEVQTRVSAAESPQTVSVADFLSPLLALDEAARTTALQHLGSQTFHAVYEQVMASVDDQSINLSGSLLTGIKTKLARRRALIPVLEAHYPTIADYFRSNSLAITTETAASQFATAMAEVAQHLDSAQSLELVDAEQIGGATAIAGATCLCAVGAARAAYHLYKYCTRPCVDIPTHNSPPPSDQATASYVLNIGELVRSNSAPAALSSQVQGAALVTIIDGLPAD